jgi:hypothetical protein
MGMKNSTVDNLICIELDTGGVWSEYSDIITNYNDAQVMLNPDKLNITLNSYINTRISVPGQIVIGSLNYYK